MEGNIFGQTSCILLSAGSSLRMGESKALLKFNTQETFIQKITGTYVQSGIKQVIVVINKELNDLIQEQKITFPEEVALVINLFPGKGRFYSLQTGIRELKQGNYCFFQNIDNPFTSAELLKELICRKEEAEVIIPVFQNRNGHPVLFNSVVARGISVITDSEIRIDKFLNSLNVKKVETKDSSILVNINSSEQYQRAGFKM